MNDLIPMESLKGLRDIIKKRTDHRDKNYNMPGEHLIDMIEELIAVREELELLKGQS